MAIKKICKCTAFNLPNKAKNEYIYSYVFEIQKNKIKVSELLLNYNTKYFGAYFLEAIGYIPDSVDKNLSYLESLNKNKKVYILYIKENRVEC